MRFGAKLALRRLITAVMTVTPPPIVVRTMSKDGADFLISDFIYTPETGNQPLSACQKGRAAHLIAQQMSPRNEKETLQMKMKFHFFSFQIQDATKDRLWIE